MNKIQELINRILIAKVDNCIYTNDVWELVELVKKQMESSQHEDEATRLADAIIDNDFSRYGKALTAEKAARRLATLVKQGKITRVPTADRLKLIQDYQR